ncbi:MAG: hypothetical protein JRJ42_10755 [Deltaproteobacteria bacterium]|nr:hypothetical protein [Deltaproteobacteria bacterium]
MNHNLIDRLRKIVPAGKNGFEGLVAKLLENLTGRHFHLARSGNQAGRDMRSDSHSGSVIAVECKRYGKSTELDERELLAEFVQACHNIPDLDLWLLVSSRDIPDQLFTTLNQYAIEQGIEFRAISAGDGSPSTLEALCAHGIQIVLNFFISVLPKQNVQQIQCELENIAKSSDFESTIKCLQNSFATASIGYEHWRVEQNQWLTQRFSTESESRSAFGQVLHVGSEDVGLVKRSRVWQELNEWLSSWGNTQPHFVLLGDEGDGKTWAVASWLNWQIQNLKDFPPVIFLSSSHPNSTRPVSLLSEAISRQIGKQDRTYWEKRLQRWVQRPIGEIPLILLVLDGINERRTPQWWRELIEMLMGSPWREQIAVLITARAVYWSRYFSTLRHLNVRTSILPPYDDTELDIAIKRHQLTRTDIAGNLLPLIRKPRYLDLVVKHRKRMTKIGDITVARLIYEDWRDRWSRKTNTFIDDQQFQSLIKGLAEKAIQGKNRISEKDVADQLPLINAKQAVLDELASGGILHGTSGSYRVDEQRLILGFGLLLVEQVEDAHRDLSNHDSSLDETIAKWMEPHQEMDIKSAILESAALHALSLQDNYPESCQVALLRAWLESKNPQEESVKNFTCYLPLYPTAYLKLAEVIWSDTHDNPWGQDLLMGALLQWRNSPSVQAILPGTFEHWLGFIHPDGHPLQRRINKQNDLEKLRDRIAERAGENLQPGAIEFAGYSLSVIQDDGLLRLGRVALAVISHLTRQPYLRAMAIGSLAEAIMDFPDKYKLFAWVIRSSPEPLWPEIEQHTKALLKHDHVVTKQAAYRLLSFEGSKHAVKMQKKLPEDLFPPHPLRELHQRDPCNSMFAWSRDEVEQCLRRKDLSPSLIARKIQSHSHDPEFLVPSNVGKTLASLADQIPAQKIWTGLGQTVEDHFLKEIESALCAYAPDAAAKIYRSIAKTVNDRKGISLRQLVLHLDQHELILDDEAKKNLQAVWHRLIERSETKPQDDDLMEEFLFHLILQNIDAEKQLCYLLKRPSTAADLLSFEHSFKPIKDWRLVVQQLRAAETVTIRRVLSFLSANPQDIPDSVMSIVVLLIGHEDSLVRSLALHLLYVQGSEKDIRSFIQGQWAWEPSRQQLENYWGSLILAKYGSNLSYSELRCRVHPSFLGFALVQRDGDKDEINQYAEDIHRIWKALTDSTPDIPSDFPEAEVKCDLAISNIPLERIGLSDTLFSRSIKFISRDVFWGGMSGGSPQKSLANALEPVTDEQLEALREIIREAIEQQTQAGNIWFSSSFPNHGLELVVRQRPDLVDMWLDGIMEDNPAAKHRLIKGRSFYESLCQVLLSIDSPKGLRLYQQLNKAQAAINFVVRGTGIPVLRYALFKAPDIPEIRSAWEQCLQQCKTDKDLLELVIVARAGNGFNWLESKVKQDLESAVMYNQARAMILRGLLAAKDTGAWLERQTKPQPETWLDRVAAKAYLYWQTDNWAKYWFERFLSVESDIHAWAAFRLLLKCADRRFWSWEDELMSNMLRCDDVNHRLVFLKNNMSTLRNSIRQNEKAMAENFLATKVLDNQTWPWMRVEI